MFYIKKIRKIIVIPKNWIVGKVRRTFLRNNENNVSYKFELVNKTVDFIKGIIRKNYKITKVIYKSGIVQKLIVTFVTVVLALGFKFGNGKAEAKEPIPQPSTSIERVILNQEFNSLEENDGQVILAKAEGVNPINIGDKSILINGNKVLIKAGHGRYLVEVFKDQVDVLGIGDRDNNRNMQTFQNLMNEMYDVNLQY